MNHLRSLGIIFFGMIAIVFALLFLMGLIDPETPAIIRADGAIRFWLQQIAFFLITIASAVTAATILKKLGKNL